MWQPTQPSLAAGERWCSRTVDCIGDAGRVGVIEVVAGGAGGGGGEGWVADDGMRGGFARGASLAGGDGHRGEHAVAGKSGALGDVAGDTSDAELGGCAGRLVLGGGLGGVTAATEAGGLVGVGGGEVRVGEGGAVQGGAPLRGGFLVTVDAGGVAVEPRGLRAAAVRTRHDGGGGLLVAARRARERTRAAREEERERREREPLHVAAMVSLAARAGYGSARAAESDSRSTGALP
jgi:hypothetical protein